MDFSIVEQSLVQSIGEVRLVSLIVESSETENEFSCEGNNGEIGGESDCELIKLFKVRVCW